MFTARKRSLRRLSFHRYLSVYGGGGGVSVHRAVSVGGGVQWGVSVRETPCTVMCRSYWNAFLSHRCLSVHWGRGYYAWFQVPSVGRESGYDWSQVPSEGGWVHPLEGTPLVLTSSGGHRKWVVRILLECFLISNMLNVVS